MLRSIATPARLIMAVFFMQAMVVANWFPRIPDMQAKLGVGPGDLAIALIGMPVGTFLILPFAGLLVDRFTPRLMMVIGMIFYCVTVALPGWAWSVPSLFVALLLIGVSYPVVDVAMNVEAARIQRELRRSIMSTCHGFWSVGSMVGFVVGAWFAQLGVDTRWHLLLVAILSLPIGYAVTAALPTLEPDPGEEMGKAPVVALPSAAILGVCVFALGGVLVEVATRNWSAIYLRDVIGSSPAATGLGLGAFALCMAIGRFFGDRLGERLGLVRLARIACLTMFAGVLVIVIAADLIQAVIGLAAAGLGVSVLFPLAVTAVATKGDRPAATNVASLALFAYGSFLLGPPLIGFVAEAAGLRIGLAILLPFLLLSTILASELRRGAPN